MDVQLQDETVWLTQKQMAELFSVKVPAISKHLSNVFKAQELVEDAVVSILETTAPDGKTYATRFYNLDAIIAVGYRVNSKQATQFRIWATGVLREYIIKGFAMDDARLKNGEMFGKDYFRELLERVRSIRASERRIYQQITDIFAECAIDYNPHADITQSLYAMIQNKFHFAITGHTAAEIVYMKANRNQPHMGLTTWKHAPDGRVLKSDSTIAKNYLSADEIKKLERAVSGYFDYIERLIENHTRLTMQALAESVDKFLSFNEYSLLEGKGKVAQQQAKNKAHTEYDAFNKTQVIESDFDRFAKSLECKK